MKLVGSDGGVVTYSPVSSIITNPSAAVSLSLYPVPVKHRQFTLNVQGLGQDAFDCRIFNMSGIPVLSMSLKPGQAFPMDMVLPANLSAGAYTLQLTGRQGKTIAQKTFILE